MLRLKTSDTTRKPLLMRIILLIGLGLIALKSPAQVLCGTANENATLTLTAPAGYKFTSIQFASYGTPNGSCGSFTTSSCHAANSASIVAAAFVGKNSASIGATNGVFGDPCVGTVKRLYVQARYDVALPLLLVDFRFKTDYQQIQLQWITADEENTSHFIIERSEDGIHFYPMDSVPSRGSGSHVYEYTKRGRILPERFYCRLKMVDQDGEFEFSKTLNIKLPTWSSPLTVTYSLQDGQIHVLANAAMETFLYNSYGQLVKKIRLQQGYQKLDAQQLPAGMYILTSLAGTAKFMKR